MDSGLVHRKVCLCSPNSWAYEGIKVALVSAEAGTEPAISNRKINALITTLATLNKVPKSVRTVEMKLKQNSLKLF